MTTTTEITRFRVSISDDELVELHARLDHARYPSQLPGSWEQGIPVDAVARLADYWRHGFDWRAREAALNAFPQFTTVIDGSRIHFLHVRSTSPDAVPLLLTHGWPGSVVEFEKVIGPLVDPVAHGGSASDAFHVIAPSLPGFGYSDPVEGGIRGTATTWAALMARLGYERYLTQGGDTGSLVSPEVARVDPEHVMGVHTNGLMAFWTGDETQLEGLTQAERAIVTTDRSDMSGYAMIQATRPQTLSYGLTDSPIGQLAWIAEKFHEWTDPAHERPEDAVDIDQLLTDVSLYWFTATAGTSAEQYWVGQHSGSWGAALERSEVPFGNAVFPGDFSIRAFAEREHHVIHWAEFDRGGHFAAMEAPDLLVGDIREFARLVR